MPLPVIIKEAAKLVMRNERRKALRRIAKMEAKKAAATSATAKTRIQGQITELTKRVEATRTYSKETGKKIRSASEVQANLAKLAQTNVEYEGYVTRSFARQNMATQVELNRASVGLESRYNVAQVHAFYRATQKAWEGVPSEDRNQAIMNYYGYNTLEEAVEDVLSQSRNQDIAKAINIIKGIGGPYTDEEKQWAIATLSSDDDLLRYLPGGEGSVPAENFYAPMG